jgi:hypothetical protein
MTDFADQITEYRTSLLQLEQQMQASYDKAVMTLSGGALGISLTFIKDVADKSALKATDWLLASWVLWGLSITCVLFSFFTSACALRKAVQQTDDKTIYIEPKGGLFNTITNILNPVAGVLFLVGVIAICVFMKGNMP